MILELTEDTQDGPTIYVPVNKIEGVGTSHDEYRRTLIYTTGNCFRVKEAAANVAHMLAEGKAVEDWLVTDSELSVKARNELKRSGFVTARQVARKSFDDFAVSKRFGERTSMEVQEWLLTKGLNFREPT